MDVDQITQVRVRNGARTLDHYFPSWYTLIDVEQLNMLSDYHDPMGQIAVKTGAGGGIDLAKSIMRDLGVTHDLFATWLFGQGLISYDEAVTYDDLTAGAEMLRELWTEEVYARLTSVLTV